MPYFIYLLTLTLIMLILCWSFQLIIGYTGIVNLAHVGLMGIGAYAAVIAVKTLHVPFGLALLIAIIAPLPFAWLLSRLTRKVSGDYLALMTLWFMFVLYVVELNLQSITRGPLGLANIFSPWPFRDPLTYCLLVSVIALAVFFFLRRMINSPFGRVLAAVRDDEISAVALGKNTTRVKTTVFLISGALAGLSGACFAFFIHFIDPASFHVPLIVTVLTIVIVGGLGSMPATTAGVIALIILQESLRFLPLSPDGIGALRQIVYAGSLLIILYYRPKGMLGRVQLPA